MPRGALKSSLLLVGTLGMADAGQEPAPAPSSISLRNPADLEAIVGVVRSWAQAWHRGDLDGMRSHLHPDLDVLILESAAGSPAAKGPMGVQAGLGKAVPDDNRRMDIHILDVQGRCASARADLGPWIAYLHLAARKDGWAIANVLWEWN
jgi:ketosteroid isomerase-like protein